MRTINEGSDLDIEAIPTSEGVPALADTLSYRIDCLTTGKEVLGWTDLTPATSVAINVPGALNAIVDNNNRLERKQMVVKAVTGGKIANQTIDWEVRNIYGI